MTTRQHTHEMELPVSPQRVFALLHTPSDIRGWWGAARAIVLPREGGFWAVAWGGDEDAPDYVGYHVIRVFDPPCRLVLAEGTYHAKSGPLPFEPNFVVEFTVEPRPGGCLLRVVQDGFPVDPVADDFYAACEVGWRNTFEGIRHHLGV
jgi:uncharacterized protein YndB with AHSA1/START domain